MPATVTVPSSSASESSTNLEKRSSASFDDILLDVTPSTNEPVPVGEVEPQSLVSPEEETKKVSMDD